jgi:hypothetical protein
MMVHARMEAMMMGREIRRWESFPGVRQGRDEDQEEEGEGKKTSKQLREKWGY